MYTYSYDVSVSTASYSQPYVYPVSQNDLYPHPAKMD